MHNFADADPRGRSVEWAIKIEDDAEDHVLTSHHTLDRDAILSYLLRWVPTQHPILLKDTDFAETHRRANDGDEVVLAQYSIDIPIMLNESDQAANLLLHSPVEFNVLLTKAQLMTWGVKHPALALVTAIPTLPELSHEVRCSHTLSFRHITGQVIAATDPVAFLFVYARS